MSSYLIELLRGDAKEMTAYNEAVDMHFAHNGWNGILKGVYQEFSTTTLTTNQLRINSGSAVMYGRQCRIAPGITVDINLDALAGAAVRFYSIYVKVATNVTEHYSSIVVDYSTHTYPTPSSDNLIENPSGVAQITLYQFKHSVNGISDLVRRAAVIEPLSFAFEDDRKTIKIAKHAESSTNSENADNAYNANFAVTAGKSVTRDFNNNSTDIATTAYVDKMYKTLWSSSSGLFEVNVSNIPNYHQYTYIMIWCRGDAGHFWPIMPRQLTSPQINNVYNGRNIAVLTYCPFTLYSGQTVNSAIGYLITTDITTILTSNRSDFRIYRIVGVK